MKGREMRKSHVAGVAVAALSIVLTASAFATPTIISAAAGARSCVPHRAGTPDRRWPAAFPRGRSVIRAAPAVSTPPTGRDTLQARSGTAFRYVQATFFVPYLDCATTTNAFSSHWVGLDGLNSQTVEQLGVEAGCVGSSPQYYAWYEMYPGNQKSAVFFVKPGNSIVASVYYDSRTRMFVLALDDTTTGQHFIRTLKCAASSCARSSAQAISEAPSDSSGKTLPLADYRAASFSGVTVTDLLGHRGTLRSAWWNTYEIIEIGGSSGSVAAHPTALYQGKAFSNYWFREN